jgi:hypothetical protein
MIRVLQFIAVWERLGGRCGYVSSQLRQYSKQGLPHVFSYLVLFVYNFESLVCCLRTENGLGDCSEPSSQPPIDQSQVNSLLSTIIGASTAILMLQAREVPS